MRLAQFSPRIYAIFDDKVYCYQIFPLCLKGVREPGSLICLKLKEFQTYKYNPKNIDSIIISKNYVYLKLLTHSYLFYENTKESSYLDSLQFSGY